MHFPSCRFLCVCVLFCFFLRYHDACIIRFLLFAAGYYTYMLFFYILVFSYTPIHPLIKQPIFAVGAALGRLLGEGMDTLYPGADQTYITVPACKQTNKYKIFIIRVLFFFFFFVLFPCTFFLVIESLPLSLCMCVCVLAYAVVGAASLAGGSTRSVSAAVIALELTGEIGLIFPCLVATIVACGVSAQFSKSVYDAILELKGIPLLPVTPR